MFKAFKAKFRLLILSTLFLSFSVLAESQLGKISDYLEDAGKKGFSGAVLISRGDKVVLDKGFGFANRKQQIPNSSKVVYDFGSLTKQFTATAIVKLSEQKRLSLEDTLDKYFKDVPEDKKTITIHNLLSHSSGISSYTANDFHAKSSDELVAKVLSSELEASPGESFIYANYGYSLLGIIIEKVTGKDYESYVAEALLKPAGLSATGYLLPDYEPDSVALGYKFSTGSDWGTSLQRYQQDGVSWNLKANGGMLSTLEDLFTWRKAVKSGDIISPDSLALMHSPHTTVNARVSYGYGWRTLSTDNPDPIIFHGGSNTIFLAVIMDFQDEDQHMMFFVSNEQHQEVIGMIRQLRSLMTDPEHQATPYSGPDLFSKIKGFFF